jgi:hypothetical protein
MYSNDRQCNVYLLCTSCWWKVLEKSTVSWFWSAGGRCRKNRRQVGFGVPVEGVVKIDGKLVLKKETRPFIITLPLKMK